MKLKNNQKGIAHIGAILLLILVLVISFVGWKVWDQRKSPEAASTNQVSNQKKTPESKELEVFESMLTNPRTGQSAKYSMDLLAGWQFEQYSNSEYTQLAAKKAVDVDSGKKAKLVKIDDPIEMINKDTRKLDYDFIITFDTSSEGDALGRDQKPIISNSGKPIVKRILSKGEKADQESLNHYLGFDKIDMFYEYFSEEEDIVIYANYFVPNGGKDYHQAVESMIKTFKVL